MQVPFKFILQIELVSLFVSTPLFSQVDIVSVDSLSLQRAVALGLEHHPSLQAAQANLHSAEASKKLSLSSYYPAISATGTGTHTEGYFVFNPSIPSRYQIYSNYVAGFSGTQLLYDFGKTSSRVGANTDFVEASEQDLRSAHDNVVMNVQLAYFAFLALRSVVTVNEEALQQAASHLAQAKAFYTVGRRPQFDVTRAEVDLANANVNLISARNTLEVARVQLDNAMGIHPVHPYAVTDSLATAPVKLRLDSVVTIAAQHRPDLLSAKARLSGFQGLVSAARSQHLPTLSANGSYNWSGFNIQFDNGIGGLYPRWIAGLTFTFPIFQGFSIDAQVEQAQASVEIAQANLSTITQGALLEVQQAYIGVIEAQERMVAAEKLVEQAEQNLNMAERQYAAGVGTVLEVTDAQLTRSNARITNIQALFDYNSSLARLQKAIGKGP
jgi:TolC family type I secretion outer membrane protein